VPPIQEGESASTARPGNLPASEEARDPWGEGYDSEEEIMRRRYFLANAAALAALGKVDTPAAVQTIRKEMNLSLAEERAGADAAEWQEIAQDYGESYPVAAPAELIEPLMVDMLGVQAAIRRNERTPAQRDLLQVAAILSAFIAQTVANLGQPLEARRWWRTAKNAADRSGDPYTALWVRGREIIRAIESRPIPAILQLIGEAEGIASQAPPEATLELVAAKAQTLALAGRGSEATEALYILRKRFGESPAGFSGNILSWGQERLHGTESFAYSRIGKLPEAEIATSDGLQLYARNGNSSIRHRAGLQLSLAFALISSGDVNEGLSHARACLSILPESHRDAHLVDYGRKLLDIVPLSDQQRPIVQEYREWVGSIAEQVRT
jgi:hypothetical protein